MRVKGEDETELEERSGRARAGGLAGLVGAIEALESAPILELATAIEDARSDEGWEALVAHHGLADPDLALTPFEYQAAVVAREAGVMCFDRTERYFLRPAPADVHPDLDPDDYRVRLSQGRLETPDMWPFRDDCPVADFARGEATRWWTHGLVHTVVGLCWWPEMGELDVLHTARFSESLSAWHWYWLGEIGREYCARHAGHIGQPFGYCSACQGLAKQTHDEAVRRRRIRGAYAAWLASSGLTFLLHEAEAMRRGLEDDELLIPPAETGLSVGEACEYAVWNHRRLRGRAFGRWIDHCMRPGLDYAPDPQRFGDHCVGVLERLLRWEPIDMTEGAPRARRARRVLQDVGYRLCQAAERAEAPNRHGRALARLGEAIDGLGGVDASQVEAVLGQALAEAVASWEDEAPAAEREGVPLFALGYRPTSSPATEPAGLRAARERAAREAMRSAGVPALFEPLAGEVIHRSRSVTSWYEDLLSAVPEDDVHRRALLAWLSGLDEVGRPDPRVIHQEGWLFRVSLRKLPPEADWPRYRARHNPHLVTMSTLYQVEWMAGLLAGETAWPPPPNVGDGSPGRILVGGSPEGPVRIPLAGELAEIYRLSEGRPSLAELVAATSAEAVDEALRRRLIVAVWQDS